MRTRHRYLWVVAAAVTVAMLVPLQQAYAAGTAGNGGTAGNAGTAGSQVARYDGLTGTQRANLVSIARDTWKFYGAGVDPATNLPMDNITFAGGSATPTAYGRYPSASNIGVYL